MKFSMRDLLMPLISLFLFSGCTNPNGIGLNDTDIENGTFTDSLTVVTETVSDNPIRVDNNFSYNNQAPSAVNRFKLLGYYNDPIFGTSTADWYSQLSIPSSNTTTGFKFPAGATLDSAVLILPYADSILNNTFYGDASSRFKVSVEQLVSDMKADSIYYSNQTFSTTGEAEIGGGTFVVNPKAKIRVQAIIDNGPDSTKTENAQIRIPINSTFATNVFLKADTSTFLTQSAFLSRFKGIKVRVDNAQTTGKGGFVYLSTYPGSATGSRIEFYYKTATDTASAIFSINGGTAQTNNFTHTYSPELTAAITAGPNQAKSYIQSTAGIRTKVSFPYLKNIAKNRKISINKAELVFSIVSGTTGATAEPLRRIYINKGQNKKGEYIQIADGNSSDPRYTGDINGFYDSSTGTYHLNIVRFVGDVIAGKTDDTDLYITVDNPSQDGGRVVLVGSGGSTGKPKLNIIYSDVVQ